MSMPTRQQRTLGGIETALQASEPRLAAMFAIFTRLHQVDGPVCRELLSRSRLRVIMKLRAIMLRRGFIFISVIAAMLAAGLLIGITGHSSASCQGGRGAHAVATAHVQPPASCASSAQDHDRR
jgi:hypothetical protein